MSKQSYLHLFSFIAAVSTAIELKVIHMNGLQKEACEELCRKQMEPICERVEFSKNRCILLKSMGSCFLSTAHHKCSRELRKSKCPKGYQHMYPCGHLVDGLGRPSCYSVSTDLSFPLNAATKCLNKGGELLSIETPGEQNHVEQVVKLEGTGGMSIEAEHYWTSGTDVGHEGHWVWGSTGKPIKYTNWNPGEPNNEYHVEHFLEIRGGVFKFQWNDRGITSKFRYICETATPTE